MLLLSAMKALLVALVCEKCFLQQCSSWTRFDSRCRFNTDGRFSGGSHGFDVGHITPEAAKGGPIGIVKNGDLIEIDARRIL